MIENNETEIKILKFLESNPNEAYSIRRIHKETGISYPTAQRAVAVLEAHKKIIINDIGNTKLVRLNLIKFKIKQDSIK